MIRLVPHSGIQFIAYDLDLTTAPRFSRSFIEHSRSNETDCTP